MQIERLRPTVLQVTLHTYEWATLVAAAQWALEGGEGKLSPEARAQLKQVLARYEAEREKLESAP